MRHQTSFANGRHLAAARAMAGLKQIELAELAGLHVNSLKRLEAMKAISGNHHSTERLESALAARGVTVGRQPRSITWEKPPT